MAGKSPSPVFRIAVAGPYHLGVASAEHRLAVALEGLGHLVYEFSPVRQPWLFHSRNGRLFLSTDDFQRFLAVEHIDLFVCADGCELTRSPADLGACAYVRLTTKTGNTPALHDRNTKQAHGHVPASSHGNMMTPQAVLNIGTAVDHAYASTPLANTIALREGILCVQDGSPIRVNRLRAVREKLGLPIRCIGSGWPTDLNYPVSADPFDTSFVSAVRASRFCARFDAGPQADSFTRTLVAADGVPEKVLTGTSTQKIPAYQADTAANPAIRHKDQTESTIKQPATTGTPRDLETVVNQWLDTLHSLLPAGKAPGATGPRRLVTALAYVGTGNFGDEYILQTLTRRLMNSNRASGVITVSENPAHTLAHRGVYAIPLADAPQVDHALARSGVALVLAGLLFDQGTRWTMGRAEILDRLTHSDLPGIDGFVALARLHRARTIFYGIGAGPLTSPDSQALVRHMGEQGSLFLTRDKESSQAILSCGVPKDQVRTDADIAFLGSASPTKRVTEWLKDHHADSAKLLAVSLRDYETIPKEFETRLASALDRFTDTHPNVRPVFCLLDSDDRAISQRVITKMRNKSRALLFDPRDDLATLDDLLSRCWEGLCLRLHCSLVLLREGVPCSGVDYLPKVAGLYANLGMNNKVLKPNVSAGQILAVLEELDTNHGNLQKSLRLQVETQRKRAMHAEKTMLTELDGGMNGKTVEIPTIYRYRWKPEGENGAHALENMPPPVPFQQAAAHTAKSGTATSLAPASQIPDSVQHPLVSVIMPVYNAAQHLSQAIESVLGQTWRNLELICVDDGSTDTSLDLLHSYSRNDKRLKIISEKNAGPGTARNKGLDKAQGAYVTFLDADDWMEKDCLKRTVSRLEHTKADMAVFSYYEFNEVENKRRVAVGGILPSKFPSETFTWRDNPDWTFRAMQNTPWNKMLRTSFVRAHHLRFEEDVRLTEDVMFSCPAMVLARAITFVDKPLVTYRIRSGTDTMANKDIHPLDFLTAFLTLQKWLKQQGVWPDLRIAYANWALDSCHYNLTTQHGWQGYKTVYTVLQKHGLADLGLDSISEKQIQADYLRDFLHDLRTMPAEQFLYDEFARRRDRGDDALFHIDAMRPLIASERKQAQEKQDVLQKQVDDLDRQLNEANARTQKVYATKSYRIGNVLVTPFARLRDAMRRSRH